MRYFDTSFLAPLILQEATSVRVERFMAALPAGDLAVSHWTCVEFSSLLARKVRMGGPGRSAAGEADAQFKSVLQDSFNIQMPTADDFNLARNYLGNYATGLLAGDALHLAIAGNHGAEVAYSFDKALLRAGKVLGLPVSVGIRAGR